MNSQNKELLSTLYGQDGLNDSYVSFQIDLYEITEKYKIIIKPLGISFPEEKIIQNLMETGSPLITFIPITLSTNTLNKCFKEIVSVFQSYKICDKKSVSWFDAHSENQILNRLTKAIFSLDREAIQKLSKPTPLDDLTLIMISKELVKPYLQELATQAREFVSFEYWKKGSCPVCGDIPNLARLSKDEEGKRYLWCYTCDMEWGFQRICCPFCGNTDHTKLKFFTTNHREELRIDVCDKCKGYVKTIDERKMKDEDQTFYIKENISSLFLDMVAEEKGYMIQLPAAQKTEIKFSSD